MSLLSTLLVYLYLHGSPLYSLSVSLISGNINENMHSNHPKAYDAGFTHDDDDADVEKKELQEPPANDPFGNEAGGEVQYRTMKWW